MEEINEKRESGQGELKSKTEDEFLVKIGAKEEEFDWDPKIVNERIRRSSSFVCAEYHRPACFRTKPKNVSVSVWQCNSPASRQLNLVTRFGPKNFYINNQNIHTIGDKYLNGSSTQALGLCYDPQTVASL